MVDKSKFLMTKKYILATFGEKDKVNGRSINKESFLNVINSDNFKRKLRDGKLFGCFSHIERINLERSGYNLPYEDQLFNTGKVCNILYDIYIKEINGKERIVGEIGIINTEAGKQVFELLNLNSNLKVSMSTRTSSTPNEWIFHDILGVDFTTDPAFETGELPISFSMNSTDKNLTFFSVVSEVESTEVKEDEDYFNEDFGEVVDLDKIESENFSMAALREYLRERRRTPAQIMYDRIRDIIIYCRSQKTEKLKDELPYLISYLRNFILDWINSSLKNPSKPLNIIIGLRITRYLINKNKARNLQMALIRARNNLKSNGIITPVNQTKLNKAFAELIHEIFYEYIKSKLPEEKQLIFDETPIVKI